MPRIGPVRLSASRLTSRRFTGSHLRISMFGLIVSRYQLPAEIHAEFTGALLGLHWPATFSTAKAFSSFRQEAAQGCCHSDP